MKHKISKEAYQHIYDCLKKLADAYIIQDYEMNHIMDKLEIKEENENGR